jgi:Uri superfamily endonuclease
MRNDVRYRNLCAMPGLQGKRASRIINRLEVRSKIHTHIYMYMNICSYVIMTVSEQFKEKPRLKNLDCVEGVGASGCHCWVVALDVF